MALPHQKQSLRFSSKLTVLLAFSTAIVFQSCKHQKKVYKSDCNVDKTFTHIGFKQLMDSLNAYDHKYVEVSGKYEEDKELSALFNDSLFVDHSNKNALWIDFSQDCPLYLSGTHTGLFDYNDGQYTRLNDRSITIRGLIDIHNKGHRKQYKGALERVSLVKL